jgi:hypothetical protein
MEISQIAAERAGIALLPVYARRKLAFRIFFFSESRWKPGIAKRMVSGMTRWAVPS